MRSRRITEVAFSYLCNWLKFLICIKANKDGENAGWRHVDLLALMILVAAVVVFFAWTAWNNGNLGPAHIIGLGASIVLLALIWFWPGNKQPTRPPC